MIKKLLVVHDGSVQSEKAHTMALDLVSKDSVARVLGDAAIGEAIGLITRGTFKGLPVLESGGRFKGVISRDSLLRAGFASS